MPSNRWEFLLRTPEDIEATVSRIAQSNLDAHRRFCFPASVRYPIIVELTRERIHTLPAYLGSAWWRHVDARTVFAANGRCEVCGDSTGVHAQHLSYEHLGNESRADLIVLCPRCREVLDQQQRVGRRYNWRVQGLREWIWITKPERERIERRRRQMTGRDPITTENLDLLPVDEQHLAVPFDAGTGGATTPGASHGSGLTNLGELLPEGFLSDAEVPLRHPVIPPIEPYSDDEAEALVEELGAAMSEPAAMMDDEGFSDLDDLLGEDWREDR